MKAKGFYDFQSNIRKSPPEVCALTTNLKHKTQRKGKSGARDVTNGQTNEKSLRNLCRTRLNKKKHKNVKYDIKFSDC